MKPQITDAHVHLRKIRCAALTINLVLDAFNSGLDTSDIAHIYNVSEAAVYNLLAKMDGEVAQ
jgi:transposase